MADFSTDISDFVQRTKAKTDEAARAITAALVASVQEKTPVVTGRLRASWQSDPPLDQIKAGDTIEITSNVEYARRVEYGFIGQDSLGRYYDQRGAGMVAQTMVEAPAIAARAIENLR